jgi:hypothetical protein
MQEPVAGVDLECGVNKPPCGLPVMLSQADRIPQLAKALSISRPLQQLGQRPEVISWHSAIPIADNLAQVGRLRLDWSVGCPLPDERPVLKAIEPIPQGEIGAVGNTLHNQGEASHGERSQGCCLKELDCPEQITPLRFLARQLVEAAALDRV